MTENKASTKVSMEGEAQPKAKAPLKKKAVAKPVVEDIIEEEVPVLSIDEEIEDLEDMNPEDLIIHVEELDPDQEIFQGGPTAGDVVAWKREYGDVYLTAIDYDNYIIWRTITRGEYRDHVKNMTELTVSGRMSEIEATLFNEEAICEMCSLFPQMSASSMSGSSAGIPALITQQVMEASGFMALEVRQL